MQGDSSTAGVNVSVNVRERERDLCYQETFLKERTTAN